jgi:hypothetical protein
MTLRIYAPDGPCDSLAEHIGRLHEDRPYVVGELLAAIVEQLMLRGIVDDELLRDCQVIDGDEWTGEYVE